MKKLKNLTFACLLIFGLAACSDDDKSDNSPVYDNSETVTSEFTGKIGEETTNTIKFTNPHGTEADLRVDIYSIDSSIKIDTQSSTCGGSIGNDTYSFNLKSTLKAGESCEIKYTFKPTKLDTTLLRLSIDYTRTFASYCPTPETVPSYETMITNNKYVDMYIYNYAKDSSGTKSPAYINVEIPAEYSVNGGYNISNLDIVSHTKDFNLPAKKGEYTFNIYGATLTPKDEANCSITSDTYSKTLIVKNDNGCSLEVKANNSYVSPIKFTPKQEGYPYYNVNVEINAKYTYNLLEPNSSKFEPEYYATNMGENTYFDAGLLKDGEEITNYEITGTDAGKFKVAKTKHNSCNIEDKKISMPNGQKSCFWTVELADISKDGNYTAELKTTLSNGATQTYNINGYVSLMNIEKMLEKVCKENSTENKQSSKAYKLF